MRQHPTRSVMFDENGTPFRLNGLPFSISLTNSLYPIISHGLVHRLVLETFVGDCPEGYSCDHIDNDPGNYHPSNLRWITCSDNQKKSQNYISQEIRSIRTIKRNHTVHHTNKNIFNKECKYCNEKGR